MSRLEVPLLSRMLRATGDLVVRAELDLWLRDSNHLLQLVTFRVDSGSEMTTLPASLARQLDLPMPLHPVPNLIHAHGIDQGPQIRSEAPCASRASNSFSMSS
jgi:hypothetical protein